MNDQGLEIIFENEDLIAINKPHGLLVHQSKIALDATQFAVQMLRNQIGQKVYLAHRLDRKTSGVLLFSKKKEINPILQSLFRERKVIKTYLAIVRGFVPENLTQIDYPLTENDKTKEAQTEVCLLKHFEINVAAGKFNTSRYSLVRLKPHSGRFHQLRKHMAHVFHPIIGDRPHGCNKQNKIWLELFDMSTMLLHAESISFPYKNPHPIIIQASTSKEFKRVMSILETE